MDLPNGRGPNWCATPMILWCWRRYQSNRLTGWIESKLEDWLGLEINREKTRVVNLKEEGASLDFLGFTFRYYDDLKGQGWRYLNVSPSAKALKKGKRQSNRRLGRSRGPAYSVSMGVVRTVEWMPVESGLFSSAA